MIVKDVCGSRLLATIGSMRAFERQTLSNSVESYPSPMGHYGPIRCASVGRCIRTADVTS